MVTELRLQRVTIRENASVAKHEKQWRSLNNKAIFCWLGRRMRRSLDDSCWRGRVACCSSHKEGRNKEECNNHQHIKKSPELVLCSRAVCTEQRTRRRRGGSRECSSCSSAVQLICKADAALHQRREQRRAVGRRCRCSVEMLRLLLDKLVSGEQDKRNITINNMNSPGSMV